MFGNRKIIAMIPARMGSKRLHRKNIRYLHDKPLIEWVIQTAKQSKFLDEIWVNSESKIVKEISKKNNVLFYQRSNDLASDSSTNDEFVEDFLLRKNFPNDTILIQLLPTSPFISAKTIDDFIDTLCNGHEKLGIDGIVSTKEEQIECVFKTLSDSFHPINFSYEKPTENSQKINPILVYACGIMGWVVGPFLLNMKKYGCGYHSMGRAQFKNLSHLESIDIDTEEDFRFAEAVAFSRPWDQIQYKPLYYGDNIEVDVSQILANEGIKNFRDDFIECKPFAPDDQDTFRVVNTKDNSSTIITQKKGEGNRKHYHPNWNEWWYCLEGEWLVEIEGKENFLKKGEFIMIPGGKIHKITAIGDGVNRRLAVSRSDVLHVYV